MDYVWAAHFSLYQKYSDSGM